MKTYKILLNQILCLVCADIITSRHRYDFVMCTCKSVGVDGGSDYMRRIGDKKNYKELTVLDDGKHSTRRKHIVWGRNYDKNMKLLPATEFIAIKDLSASHIKNILKNVSGISEFYKEVFNNELKYRKTHGTKKSK